MEVTRIFGFRPKEGPKLKMPLFTMSVQAGAPVPVDSDVEREVDLNEYLVEHPAATFFAEVKGEENKFAGIRSGDILVVDTSLEPRDGKIVIVAYNNDLAVKIYRKFDGEEYLESSKEQYLPMKIEGYFEYTVIGVVTKIIHSL